MGHGGRNTRLVLPRPWTSQYSRRPSALVAKPDASGARARVPVSVTLMSGPRLEDEVEGRLGGAAEAGEAGRFDDRADARLAGLRAEREPDLLRQRGRRAQQRGERVVGAADRVQVVLDAVAGVRLHDHPRAVRLERAEH